MPVIKKKSKKNVDSEIVECVETKSVAIEPVVLKLSISNARMDELMHTENMQSILKYNPNITEPSPYTPEDNYQSLSEETPKNDIQSLSEPSISISTSLLTSTSTSTSTQFPQIISEQSIKTQHDINCFWCCHPIIDIEYGMPIRYDVFNKTFTTYGSFCSLQCVAAHNYSVNMGCDRAWEIHSWIQLIGKKYGFKGPIRPAPSRYLLKMFNGPMTIEEFRKAHHNIVQSYVLNIPPFIHLPSQIECINTSFLDKDGPLRNEVNTLKITKKRGVSSQKGELEQKMNLAFNEST